MADSTLAAMTAASALDGTELLYVVQGGADRKATAAQVGANARTKLNANTTYYVSTTGSDSTGTGSSGNPWLTPQFALEFLEQNIDFNAKEVTVQLAAGTVGTPAAYPYIELPALFGGGVLFIETSDGNPLTTTLGTAGHNAVRAYEYTSTPIWIGGMTLIASGTAPIIMQGPVNLGIGTFNCPNLNITLTSPASFVWLYNLRSGAVFSDSGFNALPAITVTCTGTIAGFGLASDGCALGMAANYTVVGSITCATAFVKMELGSKLSTILQKGTSFVGTLTGPRYVISDFSRLNLFTGTIANMPGDAPATYDLNSEVQSDQYDVTFWDRATSFRTTLRAPAATANTVLVLPPALGPPGGTITDLAGDGNLGWLPPVSLVSALPTAVTANKGIRRFVSDATVTTFASTVAGGGGNFVPVYSDGAAWKIG